MIFSSHLTYEVPEAAGQLASFPNISFDRQALFDATYSGWIQTIEMRGLIDRKNPNPAVGHVDFVDTARCLCKPPVGAKGKVGELKQKSSIDAVVRDENHSLIGVQLQGKAHRIGRPEKQILQRIASGKSHQMRRVEPGRVKLGLAGRHFIMALHPPGAVVDIVELIDALRFDSASVSYGLGDHNAPRKWARIDT